MQTAIKGEMWRLFSPMEKPSRQKINKETQAGNYTLDQINLTDTYRTFHSKAEHTFSKCAWNILQGKPHLGSKSSLGKFKKIEIIKHLCQ